MRTTKALFVALIGMMTFVLQAQEVKTIDIVTTHSGSVWKGTIVEITEDRYYIVETLSGLIMRMPEDGIKSVRQVWAGRGPRTVKEYSFKEVGFYNTIELGLNGNSLGGGMNITYSAGHRFNKWLGVGAGLGYMGYELGWGRNTVPLFAEVRGFTSSKKISPYYAFRAGYGIALLSEVNGIVDTKGGYFFNPQVGVRFGGGSAVSFYTGLGVNIQKATYTEEVWWSETTTVDEYVFRRLELKFGITF